MIEGLLELDENTVTKTNLEVTPHGQHQTSITSSTYQGTMASLKTV